jgi:hypothetical protein
MVHWSVQYSVVEVQHSAVEVSHLLVISRTSLVGDEQGMFLRNESIFLIPVAVPSEE